MILRLIILSLTGVIPAVAWSAGVSPMGSGDPAHLAPTTGATPDAAQALAVEVDYFC
jgi:hypothetical protein